MLCLCYSLQPGHYSSLPAPNYQPIATQGVYSFRFTILTLTTHRITTPLPKNTHRTQQNTTITTHNRTLRSPHTTEHYDHRTQQNTTITAHKRTPRSPHTTEHYDHHTQQNNTITAHNGTLHSPHTTEHYDHRT